MQVDIVLWQSLELLENAELPPHNLDEASFNELLLHMSLNRVSKSGWENRFVVQNFCGRVVELVPGGKSLPISWSNRREFVGKALQFLQHEVPGLNPPLRLLGGLCQWISPVRLFLWFGLSTSWCGRVRLGFA